MSKINLILSLLVFAGFAFAQTPTHPVVKPSMTDGQIARILTSINEGEIDAARWASEHGENKDVKKFAKEMMQAHQDNSKKTAAFLKKAKLKSEDSELSKNIKDEASMSNLTLKSQKGKELDKAYINQQVTMHQNALAHINNTLIPGATNAELKTHLEKTRDSVAKHLEHAQALQANP